MKLYHFNPNNYGSEFFVMAKDKKSAIVYFLRYLDGMKKKSFDHKNMYEKWTNAPLNGPYPDGYSIDEYVAGQVIETELS